MSKENFLAYRTVLTLGKTGFGAGRRYRLIYNLGVTESGDGLLSYEYLTAYRALLTLGKTRLGAGSGFTRNNFLGVAERVNSILSN